MKRYMLLCALGASTAFGALPDDPNDVSFPIRTTVTEAGTYTVSGTGNEIVLSGTISDSVTIEANALCRITLDNLTLKGQLVISGEAILWAKGASTLSNKKDAVISASSDLMLAGDGVVALSGGGVKKEKKALVYADGELRVVLGTWNVDMSYATDEKGYGIAAKKDVVVSGGMLRVSQSGPKTVAITSTKSGYRQTGGAVMLSVGGEGAKGVKCDGAFEMSGGIFSASVTGGPCYEAYEYGDGTNLVVTTSQSSLVSTGTYLIEDVTASAAIKCDSVKVTGGTIRIAAEGICSRGLVADTTLDISGGLFDIQANGATSEPVIDLVTEGDLAVVELDRKTAACIKQGDATGAATITGGTFYLVATNYGGKCFSVDGTLTIGTNGATTAPTDASFTPDIQCSTYGNKRYVSAKKLSAYTTLGTAVATTSLAASVRQMSTNAAWVVESSTTGGGGGGGTDDSSDYTNPKCIKAESGITVESGRLRMFSKCDGGEGLESKANLTINGGIIEGTCYDDVIQATDTITVNGGYLYCGATNNDGIDANNAIVINGGIVLAFTLASPEVGIDVDSSSKLKINGGVVLAIGSASEMAYGSAGTQKTYRATSTYLSTYAGKYVKITNSSSEVYYIKVPSASSTSGTCSLVCTVPGCTAAPTVSTATTPAGSATSFHGVYLPL